MPRSDYTYDSYACTLVSGYGDDFDESIDKLNHVIRKERHDSRLTIIAVVPDCCVDEVVRKVKKRAWQFWKGSSKVLVSTPKKLQHTISREHSRKAKCEKLAIIASAEVDMIYFRVHSPIRTIKVLRCGNDDVASGDLFVRGSSKFSDVRLDDWVTRRGLDRKKIYLGKGVHVQLESGFPSSFSSNSSFSDDKGRSVADYLDQIQSRGVRGEWWNQWKGPVAAILGILVTGTKLTAAMKASAAGIYFNFQTPAFILGIGGGTASASAIVTAAGPAVLLGAATAVTVYVVPWHDIFDWIQGTIFTFGGWLMNMWCRFKSWLATHGQPKFQRQRPMDF